MQGLGLLLHNCENDPRLRIMQCKSELEESKSSIQSSGGAVDIMRSCACVCIIYCMASCTTFGRVHVGLLSRNIQMIRRAKCSVLP